jgi:hypothetical protein
MRLLAAVFCLTAFLSAQSKPAPPESLLFTNVNVVDTRQGEVAHNMTVLVEQGRIRAIAHFGLVTSGRGLRVINASGKYLIPGLWDMHTHTAERRAAWSDKVIYPLYVANGVTGVRDMGGDPALLAERRQCLERGEITGPHLFVEEHRSPPLEPTADAPQLDSARALSDLPRDSYLPAAEKFQEPASTPESISVAETPPHRSIDQLEGMLLACSSVESALRQQRLAALAHGDLDTYSTLRERTVATYDSRKAWNLFIQLSDRNTWQVPTLVWSQTMSTLDDPHFQSDPHLAYVPVHIRAQWNPEKLLQHLSAAQFARVKQEAARDLELTTDMHRAGIMFLAGTDAPDPYVIPGFSLHDELEWLVKTGSTPIQALQAATFNPALFMIKLDQYGVVEPNHVADLVLLEANPLEDIRNTRKISAVILGGKYYSRYDLDKMLEAAKAEAAKE